MKKIISTLCVSAALMVGVIGQTTPSFTATFAWDANPTYEMVTGYRIEYQKLPAVTNWNFLTFVSNTNTVTLTGLQGGYVYKFRAFAVNAVGIGTNLSNVIQLPTNAPVAVGNFQNTSIK